jgi:hypothetical protein
MALSIPDGYAFVSQTLQASFRPKPWYVTYGVTGGVSGTNAQSLRTIFINAWRTELDGSITIGNTRMRDTTFAGEAGGATLGSRAGLSTPPNISVLIEKNTLGLGRKNRGRMYMPCVLGATTEVAESGIIDTTRHTALQAAADAWYGALSGAGLGLVILHSDAFASTPTNVVNLTVDPLIATQRRRLR